MTSKLPDFFRQVCTVASEDAIGQAQIIERAEGRPLLRTESFSVDASARLAGVLHGLGIDDQAIAIRLYTGVRRQCTIALADLGRTLRAEAQNG